MIVESFLNGVLSHTICRKERQRDRDRQADRQVDRQTDIGPELK